MPKDFTCNKPKKISRVVESLEFIRCFSPEFDVAILCTNTLPYPYPNIHSKVFDEEFFSSIKSEFKRDGIPIPFLSLIKDESSDPAPFAILRCNDRETVNYIERILPLRLESFGIAELLTIPKGASSFRLVKYQAPFVLASSYSMMLNLLTDAYGYLGNILYHKVENPPEMDPVMAVYHVTKPGPFVYLYVLVPENKTFVQKLLYYIGLY